MNETEPKHVPLFRLQQFMWYLFAAMFGVITVLYVLESSAARVVALWTTVVLLVLTASKLVYIAREFRRAGSATPLALTILLLVVLISVAFLKA